MKKRILMSLFTIAIVGALIGGGVMAYFSDTETSGQNVFTAGTIDIAVDDQNPWARAEFVIASSAKPCETYWDTMIVTNVGDNDLELWKHIDALLCTGGLTSEPELEAEAGFPNDNLAEVVWYDLVVDYVVIIPHGVITLDEIHCQWIYLGTLAPGQSMLIEQSYHIWESAGNEYQGDTCTFTVEFYAEQLGGLGPSPLWSPVP